MTVDPTPSNPFGCAIALALVLMFGFFGIMTVESRPMESAPLAPVAPLRARPVVVTPELPETGARPLPANASLLGVESAVLSVRESDPRQVTVSVSGYWPDGCDFPVEINTIVTPELVTVIVYRVVPPDVFCTMMLQPYSGEIDISEAFSGVQPLDPARVPVVVNGAPANPLTK